MRKYDILIICSVCIFSCVINYAATANDVTAWFGAKYEMNGLIIVCDEMNRNKITVVSNKETHVAAHATHSAYACYDVTDIAAWSGTASVVPKGPYKGAILAARSGTYQLSAAYMTFSDSVNVFVDSPNDCDNDGMLDEWERENGLDEHTDDANDDSDGDAVDNLHEFWNGTDPSIHREIYAFPPLHRYPYSNGFYAGPDVNLEWFGSTTLGRYEVEAAVWPGCEHIVYRAHVWNTNDIGDPIVHPANLRDAIGTQCAYRIRAAFTNSTGWTKWSDWRPFKVIEPLTNHTLYLENGEPLRGCYFFFWDYTTNALIKTWRKRGFSQESIDNYLDAIETRNKSLSWKTNNEICSNDLSFLYQELGVNTVFLDQWAWKCFVGGISISNMALPGDPPDLTNIFDLTYWSLQFNRDNALCKSNNISFIPWLSTGQHCGMALTDAITSDETYLQVYNFLELKYNTDPIERTMGKSGHSFPKIFPDITGANYQRTWIQFIDEYVERYSDNSNADYNSLVKVNNKGIVMPMVALIVEHSKYYIRDYGDTAIEEFREWLSNRYGKIEYLTNAWHDSACDTLITSFDYIHPREQDEIVFRWKWRNGSIPETNIIITATNVETNILYNLHFVRACDDFDEFTIERYVDAWLNIREKVLKKRKICFAIEYIASLFSPSGTRLPIKTDVPYQRMSDFADVIIQRHGFDTETYRQKSTYADWKKTGKYIIYSGITVSNFEGTIRYYTKSAYCASANGGFYTWNELYDNSAMVLKLQMNAATGARKYFDSLDGKELTLLKNSSFENGKNTYIPHWHVLPRINAHITDTKSIDGSQSLLIKENTQSTISSDSIIIDDAHPHILHFYIMYEGTINDNSISIDVLTDGTVPHNYEINNNNIISDIKDDADYIMKYNGYVTDSYTYNSTWNESENHWVPLYVFYNAGELSGTTVLQLEITTPKDVKLYIDRIYLTKIK